MLEGYCKILRIEALTMIDMARKDILPAVCAFSKSVAESGVAKRAFMAEADVTYEAETVAHVSRLSTAMLNSLADLEKKLEMSGSIGCVKEKAFFFKDEIIGVMTALRAAADELETVTGSKYWPYPSYGELLFGVK